MNWIVGINSFVVGDRVMRLFRRRGIFLMKLLLVSDEGVLRMILRMALLVMGSNDYRAARLLMRINPVLWASLIAAKYTYRLPTDSGKLPTSYNFHWVYSGMHIEKR